jgi:hypothetical protein
MRAAYRASGCDGRSVQPPAVRPRTPWPMDASPLTLSVISGPSCTGSRQCRRCTPSAQNGAAPSSWRRPSKSRRDARRPTVPPGGALRAPRSCPVRRSGLQAREYSHVYPQLCGSDRTRRVLRRGSSPRKLRPGFRAEPTSPRCARTHGEDVSPTLRELPISPAIDSRSPRRPVRIISPTRGDRIR